MEHGGLLRVRRDWAELQESCEGALGRRGDYAPRGAGGRVPTGTHGTDLYRLPVQLGQGQLMVQRAGFPLSFTLPLSLPDVSGCCSQAPAQKGLCGQESLWSCSQKDSHLHSEEAVKRVMLIGSSVNNCIVCFVSENKMLYMLVVKFSPNLKTSKEK